MDFKRLESTSKSSNDRLLHRKTWPATASTSTSTDGKPCKVVCHHKHGNASRSAALPLARASFSETRSSISWLSGTMRRPAEEVERRGIGRMELRDVLLEDLASIVHWGKSFEKYELLDDGRVNICFTDRTSALGDVLIGADGSRSKVTAQRLPDVKREDLGTVAIAGRYVLDRDRLESLPDYLTNGALNNVVPSGKGWMFTASWKSSPERDSLHESKDHYILWAYPVPTQDTPGDIAKFSPSQLQKIALQGIRGWSPHLQALVNDADLSTVTAIPLRSMPHLDPWAPSNITLMGDAIHNMTPMAGVGANTALRDAESLARHLISAAKGGCTIVEAIGAYEDGMRQYANAAVALSRRNAVAATSGTASSRRAFKLLLRLAHAVPPVMKGTIGKAALSQKSC